MRKIIFPICFLSLIVLNSITPGFFQTQLLWFAGGLVLYLIFSRLNVKNLEVFWPFLYLISLILLSLVFFEGEVRGTNRWINLFFVRFQPSEITKPLLFFSFSGLLTVFEKANFKKMLIFGLFFFIPFFLILKQPDLGNALVYLFVFVVLALSLDFKPYYLLGFIVLLAVFSPLIWNHLAIYQKTRIISFATPQYDIKGAGYNAYQALITVGSGSFWGRGLGQGTQSHLQFLPERHTDFIFSALVEELGFVGGFALIFLYLLLFLRIISSLKKIKSHFARFFVIGVFSQIFIQVFINIGMNLGILPITGITLPLFSFGGSSLSATFISLGIISALEKEDREMIAIG